MDYYDLLYRIYNFGEEVGPRGKMTKELIGVNLDVMDYNLFSVDEVRPLEEIMKYLNGELAWYASGERDITNILPYSKFWASIRNSDNTANSNYGDLVFYRKNSKGITSYAWALDRLMNDKETRKAIVLYNDRELFYNENQDLVCNQLQDFLIRDNCLHCYGYLRSSDAIMGLQYNIPWWSLVHQRLYLELKPLYPELKLGGISFFIKSAHIYENKWELVSKMHHHKNRKYIMRWHKIFPLRQTFDWYLKNLPNYYSIEEYVGEKNF